MCVQTRKSRYVSGTVCQPEERTLKETGIAWEQRTLENAWRPVRIVFFPAKEDCGGAARGYRGVKRRHNIDATVQLDSPGIVLG